MAFIPDLIGRVLRTFDSGSAPVAARTRDGVINASARLGIGAEADNLSSQSSYSYTTISRNRQNLDNAYRGSWLVGVAVDAVADDMTRAGIELTGDIAPEDIEAVQEGFSDLGLWQALGNAVRWGRLYGGAIAVMLIDGQDLKTPLRHETIRKDQFKGLLVLDRWMVTPSLTDMVTEFGPDMGLPKFYQMNSAQGVQIAPSTTGLTTSQGGINPVIIHYSRVIRLDGNELPFYARQAEQGWGQSIIERLYDRLLAYDSASQGAAQLVFKAHLRTLKVEGLREAIAFGGMALQGITANVDMIRKFQTSDGLTLLDLKDEFDVHAYAFTGLPELLTQFSEQLSGALQIPIVRLFGQSPAGFGTGETDLQSYYDMILSQQESKMRRGVSRLLDVVARSKLGRDLGPGSNFKFVPLWQMTAKEKSEVAAAVTTAVVAASGAGIISQRVAMEELRQSGYTTGIYSNISNEDIEAAESDPPDASESALPTGTGDPTTDPALGGDVARETGKPGAATLRGVPNKAATTDALNLQPEGQIMSDALDTGLATVAADVASLTSAVDRAAALLTALSAKLAAALATAAGAGATPGQLAAITGLHTALTTETTALAAAVVANTPAAAPPPAGGPTGTPVPL